MRCACDQQIAYPLWIIQQLNKDFTTHHFLFYLQELEEVYSDLCTMLADSVLQGAEVISTRVSSFLSVPILTIFPGYCFPPCNIYSSRYESCTSCIIIAIRGKNFDFDVSFINHFLLTFNFCTRGILMAACVFVQLLRAQQRVTFVKKYVLFVRIRWGSYYIQHEILLFASTNFSLLRLLVIRHLSVISFANWCWHRGWVTK